jgi:UDP-glucose 4-epimerase
VINIASKVTGYRIPFVVAEPRSGDPAILVASSEKIRKELGWLPTFENIETIIETAWIWHQNKT